MLLARTSLHRILLGVTILMAGTTAYAVSVNKAKKEINLSLSTPAPVMEPGARLFPVDSQKGDFYILGKDEPTPIIQPAFVNGQLIQAGMSDYNYINAKPEDTIDVGDLLDEEESDDSITAMVNVPDLPKQTEQQSAENKTSVDSSFAQTPSDSKPVKEQQASGKSNLTKVKTMLHKMTRKMAVKKPRSRLQLLSVVNHKKAGMKQATRLAVVKIKYIHLA